MKIFLIFLFILSAVYSNGQLAIYLGFHGGGGTLLSKDKLQSVTTNQGSADILDKNRTWATNAKGEFLIGMGRLRIGYQFLYEFSPAQQNSYNNIVGVTEKTATTYFASSNTQLFAHYFVIELSVFTRKKFSLVPAFLAGGFSGFKVNRTTSEKIPLSQETYKHVTIGAALNGEIRIKQVTILISPNYYFFKMKDKVSNDWKEYRNFIGGDIGLRINLIKVKS